MVPTLKKGSFIKASFEDEAMKEFGIAGTPAAITPGGLMTPGVTIFESSKQVQHWGGLLATCLLLLNPVCLWLQFSIRSNEVHVLKS